MSSAVEQRESQQDLIQAQKIQFVAMMDLNNSSRQLLGLFNSLESAVNTLAKSIYDQTITIGVMLGQFSIGLNATTQSMQYMLKTLNNYSQLREGEKIEFNNQFASIVSQAFGKASSTSTVKPSSISQLGDLGNSMKESLMNTFGGLKDIFKAVGQNIIGPGNANPLVNFQGKMGAKDVMKNTVGQMFPQAKAAGSIFTSAMGAMGPQMIALALVMEPVMALINGILEPFSIITDYFGSFGEILGTSLMPIFQDTIMPLLNAFLPLIVSLSEFLAPLLQILFSFSGLGLIITLISGLMPALEPFLSILLQLLTPVLELVAAFLPLINLALIPVTFALKGWTEVFGLLTPYLEDFSAWVDNFATAIEDFVDRLMNMTWDDIGKALTGGGADNYGWW